MAIVPLELWEKIIIREWESAGKSLYKYVFRVNVNLNGNIGYTLKVIFFRKKYHLRYKCLIIALLLPWIKPGLTGPQILD